MRFSELPWRGRDTVQTYGRVSRLFHWGMAALLAWQFTSTLLRVVARDSTLYGFFWPTHTQVGFAILFTALLRGAWGLSNAAHRPSHGEGFVARLARLGHLGLYSLMILIPSLALLRSYGSGRGFSFLGIPVVPATGEQVAALTAPGNAAHGLLGWILLALIAGHIAMAFYHTIVWKDGTLERMRPV